MFGKQILEVCTIVAYWILFVPTLLYWLQIDYKNKPFDYFFDNSHIVLFLIMGYLGLYHVVLYVFIKMQWFDLDLWHKLTKTKKELDMQLEEAKWMSNYMNLDQVDGAPATISYSTRTLPKKRPPPPPASSTRTLPRQPPRTLILTPPGTPPRTPRRTSPVSPMKPAPPIPSTPTMPRPMLPKPTLFTD